MSGDKFFQSLPFLPSAPGAVNPYDTVENPTPFVQGRSAVPGADVQSPWDLDWQLADAEPQTPTLRGTVDDPALTPPPAPAPHTSFGKQITSGIQSIIDPIVAGIPEAQKDITQTSSLLWGKNYVRAPGSSPELEAPITSNDSPGIIGQKALFQATRFAPTAVAGALGALVAPEAGFAALAGGAVGTMIGTFGQVLGQNFDAAYKAEPNDPDAAYAKAVQATAIDTGAAGLGALALGVTPFADALKNALFQTIVVQPAIGVAWSRAHQAATGQYSGLSLGDEYLNMLAPSALMAGVGEVAHSAARAAGEAPWALPWKSDGGEEFHIDPDVSAAIAEEGGAPDQQTAAAQKKRGLGTGLSDLVPKATEERTSEAFNRQFPDQKPTYPMAPKSEWYGDANYEQTGGKIEMMSPDEFLAKARPLQVDETSRENIDDLKKHIQSGKTLDPLQFSPAGKEDGRHRAIAAKELGIDQVPVITWPKSGPKFQRGAAQAEPFFYKSERLLDELPVKRATGEQWLNTFRNKGVKQEEIDDLGLSGLPKDQPVTRDQVKQLIDANRATLREVNYGGPENLKKLDQWQVIRPDGHVNSSWAEESQAHERATAIGGIVRPSTDTLNTTPPVKFGQYQLPGGQNYREMVLALPHKGPTARTVSGKTVDVNPSYTDSHWPGVSNPIGHLRMSDRVGPNGEKVLHVEEVQSGMHQKGRKEGYDTAESRKRAADAETNVNRLFKPVGDMLERNDNLGFDSTGQARKAIRDEDPKQWEFSSPEDLAMAQEYHQAIVDLRTNILKADSVPDAPLKKTWHELLMKKAIAHAVQNGYDALAITPGEEQAKRYDLSTHLDRIEYQKEGERFRVRPYTKDDPSTIMSNDQIPQVMTLAEVEKFYGKDVADRIEKNIGEPPAKKTKFNETMKILRGDNLSVGGEGMKAFYDRMLPQFLNRYGKKFGAKVTSQKFETGSQVKGVPTTPDQVRRVIRDNDLHSQPDHVRLEASAYYHAINREGITEHGLNRAIDDMSPETKAFLGGKDEGIKTPLHTLPLTPELKASVLKEGQPMYQRGASSDAHENVIPTKVSLSPEDKVQRADMIRRGFSAIREIAPYAKILPVKKLLLTKQSGQQEPVTGAHFPESAVGQLIAFAIDSRNGPNPDTAVTGKHEGVHWIWKILKPKERAAIKAHAESEDWLAKYDIPARYKNLSHEGKIEEALADHIPLGRPTLFEGYPPAARRAMLRLDGMLTKLDVAAQRVLGRDVTAEQVMRLIETGAVGRRAAPPVKVEYRHLPLVARPYRERKLERSAASDYLRRGL